MKQLKVFVSHQKRDSDKAALVAARLTHNNLSVYLDVIDDAFSKDGEDLADYIRSRMSECDQLMAVVSAATKESWWVPWEIGVATEKSFLISTYATDSTTLPEYLKKWPYLKTLTEIDTYAQNVKQAKRTYDQKKVAKSYGILTQAEEANIAKTFHKDLKRALGQMPYARY